MVAIDLQLLIAYTDDGLYPMFVRQLSQLLSFYEIVGPKSDIQFDISLQQ